MIKLKKSSCNTTCRIPDYVNSLSLIRETYISTVLYL